MSRELEIKVASARPDPAYPRLPELGDGKALLLACVVGTSLMTGCGSGQQPQGTAPEATQSEALKPLSGRVQAPPIPVMAGTPQPPSPPVKKTDPKKHREHVLQGKKQVPKRQIQPEPMVAVGGVPIPPQVLPPAPPADPERPVPTLRGEQQAPSKAPAPPKPTE
jgi:hypothetical protein